MPATFTKSALFRRAWSVVRFNNGKVKFGDALRLAWREAKAGDFEFWAAPDAKAEAKARIVALENTNRLGVRGARLLEAAYADFAAAA